MIGDPPNFPSAAKQYGTVLLSRKRQVLAKPGIVAIVMDMSEDNKQSAASVGRGSASGRGSAAGVCPSIQPENVHAAPVVRLLGAEGLLRSYLPWHDRLVGGLRVVGCGDPVEEGASLHDAAKSGRSVADSAFVPAFAHRHAHACQAAQTAGPPFPTGCDGQQRIRVAARQPLLCPAAKKDGRTWAKMPSRVSSLSETQLGLRNDQPSDCGSSCQPGTQARFWRIRAAARRRALTP